SLESPIEGDAPRCCRPLRGAAADWSRQLSCRRRSDNGSCARLWWLRRRRAASSTAVTIRYAASAPASFAGGITTR
ncbi:MAG: hypothetical protein WAV88_11285, partial [Candidatus Nanopelagicales bacterium]